MLTFLDEKNTMEMLWKMDLNFKNIGTPLYQITSWRSRNIRNVFVSTSSVF